jgi:CheY-like chemotaxis protein
MSYHILLVDDDIQLHELVEDALEPLDVRLSTAITAEEGIKIAVREQPVLILMDLLLPVATMKGWDAIAALKANPKTEHITTIALTAAPNDDILKALHAGAIDYIAKPFSINQLQSTVMRIFGAGRY